MGWGEAGLDNALCLRNSLKFIRQHVGAWLRGGLERRQNETKAIQCDLYYRLPATPPPASAAGHLVIQVALHRQLKLLPLPPSACRVSPKSNKLYRFNKLVHPNWTLGTTWCPAQQLSRVQQPGRQYRQTEGKGERGKEREAASCSDC